MSHCCLTTWSLFGDRWQNNANVNDSELSCSKKYRPFITIPHWINNTMYSFQNYKFYCILFSSTDKLNTMFSSGLHLNFSKTLNLWRDFFLNLEIQVSVIFKSLRIKCCNYFGFFPNIVFINLHIYFNYSFYLYNLIIKFSKYRCMNFYLKVC